MDWHAYNQYGNPPNVPYQMPTQGFAPPPPPSPQYPQTWQSQPPVMPQHIQPSPPPPQQYQHYPQQYQYQQQSHHQVHQHHPLPQFQHPQGYAPQPYVQPSPPQHHQSRPVLLMPQRSGEYLSQFQDFSHSPIAHLPPKPQQQAQPMAQPQRRVSQQQQMPPPQKPKPPEAKVEPSPPPPKREEPPVDFQLLLMSLADEYIERARAMGSAVAIRRSEADLQQYYKLMATGMGCLDAILRKQRLQPRAEASLRLRYATLLYEETNNDMDIEQMLSKGILLCERNRFLDLKYSMQYLQAKALFRSKPKAALTSIDKIIQDTETLQTAAWIYAFRFLRFSLSLQRGHPQDRLAAIQQLRSIASTASRQQDAEISLTCAVFEAMVHLRSGISDSMEQVQRAVATARRYQSLVPVKDSLQVSALLIFIELACSLQMHQPAEEVQKKMEAMQSVMDDDDSIERTLNGNKTFTVPLSHQIDHKLVETTGGIFQSSKDGRTSLNFSWLPQRDLYMLGYYLSGVTTLQIKPTSDIKATEYLKEGVKQAQASMKAAAVAPTDLACASTRLQWQATIHWYMQLHLAFIACQRADWKSARIHLKALGNARDDPLINMSDDDTQWLHYLSAVIAQGTGDLETAFEIFQSERFSLPDDRSTQRHSFARNDLCVLAALNSLLIIRTPSHPQHGRYHETLTKLEAICSHHTNNSIQSAFALLRSIAPRSNLTESMIVKTKQHLQAALQLAKPLPNNQLLAMSLNFMTALFFKDIVGDQAEKSARTAQHLAKRARSNLWMSVADGQLGETLDKCGKREEAAQVRAEAEKLALTLPKSLRQRCEQG